MTAVSNVIDVLTQGSDRPLRRLLAYYAIVAVIVAALAVFFPRIGLLVAGIGLREVAGTPQVLADALSCARAVVPVFGPGSRCALTFVTNFLLPGPPLPAA